MNFQDIFDMYIVLDKYIINGETGKVPHKLAIPDDEDYFHIKLLENTDRLQTFVPTLI